MEKCITLSIYKKGTKADLKNYRDINLLNYKIHHKNYIGRSCDDRHQRSDRDSAEITIDAIFTLIQHSIK